MQSHRNSVKTHANNNKKLWRDKFKSQCAERVKVARQTQVDQRRYDSWMNSVIAQEWRQFQKDHEMELQEAGLDLYEDLDALLEDNTHEPIPSESLDNALYEEYERQQQEELDTAIAEYESISQPSILCMKCRQLSSFQQGDCHRCSACGFTLNKERMEAVDLMIQNHANVCHNRLDFTVEPGEDGSIIGLCTICDLWMLV